MRYRLPLTLAIAGALTLPAGVPTAAADPPSTATSTPTSTASIAGAWATANVAGSGLEPFPPPRRYYLALGDSIAYGFQTRKALQGLPPGAFDTGFVDVFGARLRQARPSLVTVNYSCPGESTASIRTPCGWKATGHALHDDYHGSQLDAAVSFLEAHPGRVSPITVSLNGNDIDAFVRSCPPDDITCLQHREHPARSRPIGGVCWPSSSSCGGIRMTPPSS